MGVGQAEKERKVMEGSELQRMEQVKGTKRDYRYRSMEAERVGA